jgi:hypothetical protein
MKKQKKENKCFNCKERTDDLMQVRQKGKIRQWCLDCYRGYLLTISERNKKNNQSVHNFLDRPSCL